MQPNQHDQETRRPEQGVVDGGARSKKSKRDLVAWLRAEDTGNQATSERALLELLSHLPEASPAGVMNAGLVEPSQRGSADDFAMQLVRRIENESRINTRWTLGRVVALCAVAIVVCWGGILLFAVLLGLDPTATTAAGEALAFCARSVARVPATLAAAVSGAGHLWMEARTATEWMYSPWLLLGGWLSLCLASAALVGLGRLLPEEHGDLQAGYEAPSLGAV